MTGQTFLVRRGARYHFRRRVPWFRGAGRPISIALQTSDPVEARRLARWLAQAWDRKVLHFEPRIERGTLSLDEADALFRQGLKDELPLATAHVTAPIGDTRGHPSLHKVMAAALRIVSRVPHDCAIIDREIIETEIDETWTDAQINLLRNNLQFHVTPMKVSRTDAKDALEGMGVRPSDALIREARSHILQGRAEAHDRSVFLDHPDVRARGGRVLALLDDMLVAAIRSSETIRPLAQVRAGEPLTPAMPFDGNAQIYARPSLLRFSEIIDETLGSIVQQRKFKPDNGQRLAILQRFAWLTGDKPLCEYNEGDVGTYVARLRGIPNDFVGGSCTRREPWQPNLWRMTSRRWPLRTSVPTGPSIAICRSCTPSPSSWRKLTGG